MRRSLLAVLALGACGVVSALEPPPVDARDSEHHARQRQVLEAYVDCIRDASAGDRLGPPRPLAAVCASERAAYRATLPPERAARILEEFDAGAAGRTGR